MNFDPDQPSPTDAGVFGLPRVPPKEGGVVLVPVPFEATVSYCKGTSLGPKAILEASQQVDLFDAETGCPYEAGITMLPEDPQVLQWDHDGRRAVDQVHRSDSDEARAEANAIGAKLNQWVQETVGQWIDKKCVVGTIGGEHAVSFGAIAAHAERWPGLGVLQLDAHADLREAYEGLRWSHASVMWNVLRELPAVGRLVQVGVRDFGRSELLTILDAPDRIRTSFGERLALAQADGVPWSSLAAQVVEGLPEHVYLSIDIDGLDQGLCPHTGTPVPGGLGFYQAVALVAAVAQSGRRIVGFDLVEVAPGPTGDDWDGNVGARLLYKVIGWTLRSQGRRPHSLFADQRYIRANGPNIKGASRP